MTGSRPNKACWIILGMDRGMGIRKRTITRRHLNEKKWIIDRTLAHGLDNYRLYFAAFFVKYTQEKTGTFSLNHLIQSASTWSHPSTVRDIIRVI